MENAPREAGQSGLQMQAARQPQEETKLSLHILEYGQSRRLKFSTEVMEEKTNWQMHEYVLELDDSKPVQNSFVLCKVFQKAAPKRCEGCTSEVPFTEAGIRSSLGVESDSLATQPTDVFNPNVDCNFHQGKTLMEDTCKYPRDSLPPDDEIHMFLMRHLCDGMHVERSQGPYL